MSSIVDILEQKMRPSRWPFTYPLLDPERNFEDVQIGWLFKCLGLTILRIKWPTFIYGTAITTGIVEKAIVINFFGHGLAIYR
jgi:hypothetical protein